MTIIQLTPPLLLPESLQEKISCIRSHRERIFRVEIEERGSKLIVHNYGHGGTGWTFLFGTVRQAIALLEEKISRDPTYKAKDVVVIGAGCYGLLTALLLSYQGYNVSIVAQATDNLTSHKAAGFFFPRPRKCSTPEERALFATYGIASYQEYRAIALGNHPFLHVGARILPAYFGMDIDPGFTPYLDQNLISPPREVMIDFGNGKIYPVHEYYIVFMQTTLLMQELQSLINRQKIPMIRKKIETFEEIDALIIMNCSGAGARHLTHDKRLVPVQGHLITLKEQPSPEKLSYLLNVKVTMTNQNGRKRDELIYFAPKEHGILGITFIRGQESPTANAHEFDRLLQRCKDFFGT